MPMKTKSARYWFPFLSGFLFLILAAGAHAVNTYITPVPHPPIGTLSPSEVKKLIRVHKNVTLIDVRNEAEFEKGHVPGAINIPVHVLTNQPELVPAGPVLLICRSGRRAERAYDLIHDERPTQPLWYLEGSQSDLTDSTAPIQ